MRKKLETNKNTMTPKQKKLHQSIQNEPKHENLTKRLSQFEKEGLKEVAMARIAELKLLEKTIKEKGKKAVEKAGDTRGAPELQKEIANITAEAEKIVEETTEKTDAVVEEETEKTPETAETIETKGVSEKVKNFFANKLANIEKLKELNEQKDTLEKQAPDNNNDTPVVEPTPETLSPEMEKIKKDVKNALSIEIHRRKAGGEKAMNELEERLFAGKVFREKTKEENEKKKMAMEGSMQKLINRGEEAWKNLDKTVWGKTAKVVASSALIGAGVLYTASNMDMMAAGEIGGRLLSRVGMATVLNVALTKINVPPKTQKYVKIGLMGLGLGAAFMVGGPVSAIVAGGGMLAKLGVKKLTTYLEGRIEKEEQKVAEKFDRAFDINKLSGNKEILEQNRNKIDGKIKWMKWGKKVLNLGVSFGTGLATIGGMQYAETHDLHTTSDVLNKTTNTASEVIDKVRGVEHPIENPVESASAEHQDSIPAGTEVSAHSHASEVASNPTNITTEHHEAPASTAESVVHQGEGQESSFIRQIENNEELARNAGWDGKEDLHHFAGRAAHSLAMKVGIVDADGNQEAVHAGESVVLKFEDGHFAVDKINTDGELAHTYHEGDTVSHHDETAPKGDEHAQPEKHDDHTPPAKPDEHVPPAGGENNNPNEQISKTLSVVVDRAQYTNDDYDDMHDHLPEVEQMELEMKVDALIVDEKHLAEMSTMDHNNPEYQELLKKVQMEQQDIQATYGDVINFDKFGENQDLHPTNTEHHDDDDTKHETDSEKNPEQEENLINNDVYNLRPQALELYNDNAEYILQTTPGGHDWHSLITMHSAKEISDMDGHTPIFSSLRYYIHTLEEATGLHPRGATYFNHTPETVEHFIVRAVKAAEKLDVLDNIKMNVLK
ncbi:MAG: hypothetical protein V4439_02045 [Patescibacteria group bacterium]